MAFATLRKSLVSVVEERAFFGCSRGGAMAFSHTPAWSSGA